jgi:F0F1-type ATP synthase membrane subunit b/b'
MSSTFLQIFLLLNVFLIGVAAAIGTRHAYAHFKPHPSEKPHPADNVKLPAAIKQQLLQTAQVNYQKILERSAIELQQDLKTTADQLSKQLARLGGEIVNEEMKHYRASLEDMRKQTDSMLAGAAAEVDKHQVDLKSSFTQRQTELETKLAEEIEIEKQNLIKQIDTKLGDAVASFLIETMQHDVDLGAQVPYLTKMLEEHKADFKQGVGDEVATAK